MARNVPQFIDVPRGPKKASGAKELTIVPSGEAPGAFENISVASVWLNTKGDKVYIKGDTSIEITPADKSDVRGPVEQLFGSPEEVKAFLKEQGYAFSHVRGGEREGTSFTGSLESEGTGETKAQLDEQIADLIENIDSKKQAINSAINKANELSTIEGFESMRSILDEISKQTEELLWQVNKISLEDDKLDSSENDLDFTLKEKLKNKNSLNQIEEDLATLLKNAQVTLESLKKLASVSSDTSGEGATPPAGAGESTTSDKPEPKRMGKGGGSGDGGDGGEHSNIEKEFKAFLERPDGKEIVDTYKMIIKGEWQYFTQAVSRTQKYLSLNEKIDVWENDEHMLPAILTQLSKDLTQKHSVTKDQASAILRVVLGQLHTEFLDKQEEKRKQNQGAK